ncbi:MAG: SPASM domain-containing protein [Alphaproteobacteria bacterium]|nr:SPASM domain-containing protein [Alphaproteobacteria bacterium]
MEALYWVLTWACHRKCRHCYDDRFRPYVRDELKRVVGEGQAAYRAIVANLPDVMTYADPKRPGQRKQTLLVLAGGEVLIDGVREELFYPTLDAIKERWGANGPHISVQTTGDVLKPRYVEEMLARGVGTIAIASIDDFHVGFEGEKKFAFMDEVRALMAPFGLKEIGLGGARDPRLKTPNQRREALGQGPFYLFFGAQPELWIGELWPRGRAWTNGLTNATYETNFCARWSGGRNFLNFGEAGSEVAIEPDGSIYPCCLKTKAPLGNLTEERLEDILASLKGHPALEAINAGDPEAMGLSTGWSREDYRKASSVTDPKGRPVANVCLGCDVFFEKHLGEELQRIRADRLAARALTNSNT